MDVGCIAYTVLKKRTRKVHRLLVVVLWCVFISGKLIAQNTAFNTVDELKAEANRLFEDDEYAKCYKLYSQLVSNYPKDPEYNYRLGVCILFCEPDKKKAFNFLQFAVSKPDDTPKDAVFFLAKAYHLNYQFDDALKYYNDYKKIAPANQQKKLQVDKEIKACVNGKRLLGSFADLEVLAKKQLNEVDYFRSYDLSSIGGRLLVKPEDFKTNADKKKKDKSVVFLPKGGEKVFYSSYGDNYENGRDLFYAIKLPNGTFSKPKPVKGVNTPFDEDFPFLHPNGRTLYFASKGHNSMGGYDIFKSTYIAETDSWSQPINLEFPINSPDDDYLFVTDESEKVAYFSTGRYAPPNKIDVLKVNTERIPLDVVSLKGTVVKENPTQSVNSKITVKNMDNGAVVGTFMAENNGNYNMLLPNGGQFIFTVETPGLETQSDRVALPVATSLKPFKQTISYDSKLLKIINYFDETPSDDSYVQYLKLIEEKAKLDVKGTVKPTTPTVVENTPSIVSNTANASSTETNTLANVSNPSNTSTSNTATSVATTRPTVVDNTPLTSETNGTAAATKALPKTDSKKGIDNKALIDLAKKEAEEANKEAIQLQNDANDANELLQQTRIETDKLEATAKTALANAENISDASEKKAAIEKANAIQKEATAKRNTLVKLEGLAKALQTDASNKQKEGILNQQYAKVLEDIVNPKASKETLSKLEALQKQLETIENDKPIANEAYNAIKLTVDEKEKDLAKSVERVNDAKANKEELEATIKIREEDLGKAKRKEKKEIETDIANLKTELAIKEKVYTDALAENQNQTTELETVKADLELTNRIKNEAVTNPISSLPPVINTEASTSLTAVNSNTNSLSESKAIRFTDLKEKFSTAITPAQTPNEAQLRLEELNTYNAAINEAIAQNKLDLTKTKAPTEKAKITSELKALDKQKQDNTTLIAQAKKVQLGSSTSVSTSAATAGNSTSSTTNPKSNVASVSLAPISATAGTSEKVFVANTEAEVVNATGVLQNQLLDTELKAIYTFNNYTNATAIEKQTQTLQKLETLTQQETNLKQSLNTLNETIKNQAAAASATSTSIPNLIKQAEDLMTQARQKREEAKTKKGDEKEKLMTEAKTLDQQSNETYLNAAAETKKLKQGEIAANAANIEGLLNTGKSVNSDVEAVKKLAIEIEQLKKQDFELRTEADSQVSYGAKIGAMSNAEEKENEIIQKQEQAIFILLKTNPNYPLKKANGTATSVNIAKENIEAINTQLITLNREKVNVLANVVEANNAELNAQNASIAKQAKTLAANADLKAAYTAVQQSVKASNALLNEANKTELLSQKLSLVEKAAKQQQEAIVQFNALSNNLKTAAEAVVSNAASTTNSPTVKNSTTSGGTPSTTNDAPNSTANTTNALATNSSNTATNPSSNSTSSSTNTSSTNSNNTVINPPNNSTSGTTNTSSTNSENTVANPPSNSTSGTTNTSSTNSENTVTNPPSNSTSGTTNTSSTNSENTVANLPSNSTSGTTNTSSTNSSNTVTNEATANNGNANTKPTSTVETSNGNAPLVNANTTSGNTLNSATPSNTLATSGNTTSNNSSATLSSTTNSTSNTTNPVLTATYTVDVNTLTNPDTSFKSLSTFFERNPTELKNPASNSMVEKALNDLKLTNAQLDELNATKATATATSAVSTNTLSSLQLEEEIENITRQATLKRQEANAKKGKEKERLLNEAKQLDNQAILKKVEAAQITLQTNDAQYEVYNAAITELLNKSKGDNLVQTSRLEETQATLINLRKEANNLRQEANALTNDAARLGAIENAEEKETELLQKQKSLVEELKQAYPTYVVKSANTYANLANGELFTQQQNELSNKQFDALTLLTNAYNLSIETNKSRLPKTLTAKQQTTKTKVEQLSTDSKRLLIQASKTQSNTDRTKLYAQAAKNSYEAVKQLNTLLDETATNAVSANNPDKNSGTNTTATTSSATNTTAANVPQVTPPNTALVNPRNTGNAATAANAPRNATNATTRPSNTPTGNRTLRVEGLEIINGNAYSATKPIPIDEKIPDGLVFRVQVGAFKQQLPNTAFKGLTPVNGQTTSNGYVRYTVGNFNNYANANGVKNDLRRLGYNDAFVVVYFNGKKMTLSEASEILKNEGKTIENSLAQTAGITGNMNIPKPETILQTNVVVSEQVVVTKELEQTKDLLYTVQIGVYSKQVTKLQLGNLSPIYTERLPSGLYRYTAGIYNKAEKIINDKNRVITLGIKDAFTTAYLNGKRIAFAEARQKQDTEANIRMEAENPIVFPNGNVTPSITSTLSSALPAITLPNTTNLPTPSVTPFSNGVSKSPEPTAENGVKADNTGLSFKVQIGAFSRQVPNDVAAKFLTIKTWPIENLSSNGLYIYSIGNFVGATFAKKLKEEVKALGISDAFVTVYRDGVKLSSAEAAALINR